MTHNPQNLYGTCYRFNSTGPDTSCEFTESNIIAIYFEIDADLSSNLSLIVDGVSVSNNTLNFFKFVTPNMHSVSLPPSFYMYGFESDVSDRAVSTSLSGKHHIKLSLSGDWTNLLVYVQTRRPAKRSHGRT